VYAECSHIESMPTLTIRNVPDDLHNRLKEKARRNRRSLNQEVIAELMGGVGDMADVLKKKERAEVLLAKIDQLRAGLVGSLSSDEIDAARREGRL